MSESHATLHPRTVLLSLPAVRARTGLGKTAVYTAMKRGEFPRPIKLGPRRVAWLGNEIEEWINRGIAERDAVP